MVVVLPLVVLPLVVVVEVVPVLEVVPTLLLAYLQALQLLTPQVGPPVQLPLRGRLPLLQVTH